MAFSDWITKFGTGVVEGFTKPETILGTIGLFANRSAQNNAVEAQLDASREAAQQKFDNDIAILNLKHQQDLELLAAKGGGGGGGGASMAIANAELALKRKQMAQERAIAKLNAVQTAKKMELDSTLAGGDLRQRALENMMQAATAPLGR